jgi:hypothetical protein
VSTPDDKLTAALAQDAKAVKKLPKREAIDLVETILRRLAWLDQHDSELADAHVDRLQLVRLLRILYTIKLPCTERDLRMMLDLTVPLLHRINPHGPVEYASEYLKTQDLTADLCGSLRVFQASLREDMSCGQAAMQSLRQQLHVLLWLDEWDRLDPARCWSECIRRDYRGMIGDRRINWRRLLKHLRGNAPTRMPASWAREAEARLADVGLDDFRQQFSVWFAPFRSGEPLPLSVAGSHVLKGLLWFASLTRDDDVKESAMGLLEVKWKQKRNSEKSMVALDVFGVTKEDLRARQLIKPEAPPQLPKIIERLLSATLVTPIDRMAADEDGDLLVIQGQLHFYRLYRSTGRIERATDNALMELEWAAVPDQFRLVLHRECDSVEQAQLRAHLLLHDSVFGRWFKYSPSSSPPSGGRSRERREP